MWSVKKKTQTNKNKTNLKIEKTSTVKWNLDGSQAVTLISEKQTNSIFKFIGFVLYSVSAELHDGEDKFWVFFIRSQYYKLSPDVL